MKRRIGVLCFTDQSDRTQIYIDPILEAGEKRGHEMIAIYQPFLTFTHTEERVEVLYKDEPLPQLDGIIARPNIFDPSPHKSTIELLRQAGYLMINNMQNFSRAKNKLDQRSTLSKLGIPMPKWAVVRQTEQAVAAAKNIGFPVILKTAMGSLGNGVFYAENTESLMPIADHLAQFKGGAPLIIEEFIKHAERKDIRAFVIDGHIVAAMERNAREGDVRANASIGGVGVPVELTPEEIETAIRVAAAFSLDIAGVDMMRSERGPLVLEVNSNPGFIELQEATGIDVAAKIVEYAENKIDRSYSQQQGHTC